jgi:hypothetical protein
MKLCGFISESLFFFSVGLCVYFFANSGCFYFFFYYGCEVSFEVSYCGTSSIALFAQDHFGYLESFVLPCDSPYFCKECYWNFDGDCIESVNAFWKCSQNINPANQ